MGMRYYKADWGRFINRDPSGESGGANLFAYCGNDPVNNVDPLGLDDKSLTRATTAQREALWLQAAIKEAGRTGGPLPVTSNDPRAMQLQMNRFTQAELMAAMGDAVNRDNSNAANALMSTRFYARSSQEPSPAPLLGLIPGFGMLNAALMQRQEANAGHNDHVGTQLRKMIVAAPSDFMVIGSLGSGLAMGINSTPGHILEQESLSLSLPKGTPSTNFSAFTPSELKFSSANLAEKGVSSANRIGLNSAEYVGGPGAQWVNEGRGLWTLTEEGADKIVRGPFGKIYRSPSDKLWWSADNAAHGGSAFKVYEETGQGLQWFKDAD